MPTLFLPSSAAASGWAQSPIQAPHAIRGGQGRTRPGRQHRRRKQGLKPKPHTPTEPCSRAVWCAAPAPRPQRRDPGQLGYRGPRLRRYPQLEGRGGVCGSGAAVDDGGRLRHDLVPAEHVRDDVLRAQHHLFALTFRSSSLSTGSASCSSKMLLVHGTITEANIAKRSMVMR